MQLTHSPSYRRHLDGFTLLEMSIVLVIIGLLSASVLVGRTLIRQSQVNSIEVDFQHYVSATNIFYKKYTALPGDMGNATTYWGAMSTCPPTAGMASPGGTATCNGTGNGQIFSQMPGGNATEVSEQFLFWQHLANEGLITGTYTGIPGSLGTNASVPGTNVPFGHLPGIGFEIEYFGLISPSTYDDWALYDSFYGHVINIGAYSNNGGPYGPILTTLESESFDRKFDDGLPATGNVRTWRASAPWANTCVTSNLASAALYNIALTGPKCSLILLTGF